MTPKKNESEKPLLVLVYEPSFLRLWMVRALSSRYRLIVFSSSEDAILFVKSVQALDILITDLDFGPTRLDGCGTAKATRERFPRSVVLIFSDTPAGDYRFTVLRGMGPIHFLSKPFGAFFIATRVAKAIPQAPQPKRP